MTAKTASLQEVKQFWNDNPLFTGESKFPVGSKEFVEDHKDVYINDVFAGNFKRELIFPPKSDIKVLDLGCGIGFLTIELLKYHSFDFTSADLTENALDITLKRLQIYSLKAVLQQENAEQMSFNKESFDHVNCQGVIHHTPNTEATISEIARILKKGGTDSLSVYYKNLILKNWKILKPFGKLLHLFGGRFKGRGRDNIFLESNIDNITRLYDGVKNPIGKSYSRKEFRKMVGPYFTIENEFLFFFPARSLPIPIPNFLHRFLANKLGFMIHLNLRKK